MFQVHRITWVAAAAILTTGSATAAEAVKRHVLSIGVQKYEANSKLADVPFAEADATDFAKVIRGDGWKETDIVTLTTADRDPPTAVRINSELATLFKKDFGPDDVVIVTFSGHGVEIKGRYFFCPAGADLEKPETLIDLTKLCSDLGACRASSKVLIADACRSVLSRAPQAAPAVVRPPGDKDVGPSSAPIPANVTAFYSCAAGQKSYAKPEFGHGIFFHFVIEAIRDGAADSDGNGEITMSELNANVRVELGKFYKDGKASAGFDRQTPHLMANNTVDCRLSRGPWKYDENPVPAPAGLINAPNDFRAVHILADGERALLNSGADGGSLTVYNLAQRKAVARYKPWPVFPMVAANIDPEGKSFFLGANQGSRETRNIRLMNTTGAGVASVGHGMAVPTDVGSLAVDSRGRYLAVGEEGKFVRVYELNGARPPRELPDKYEHNTWVNALAFSRDGSLLAVGCSSGQVYIYDVKTGANHATLTGVHQSGHPTAPFIMAICFDSLGNIVTVARDNQIMRWKPNGTQLDGPYKVSMPGNFINSARITPDCRRVILGGNQGDVVFWDLGEKPREVASYPKQLPSGEPVLLSISPNGKRAVAANYLGEVRLFEAPQK